MLEVYKLKVYQFRDQEVSEDAAIFAEVWYEALEDLYGSFSEFLTSCVRKETYPYRDNPRSEKVSKLLKDKGWANSHSIDVSRGLYEKLEARAEEKGQTVSELVSEIVLENTKPS
jgi:hypothetical protein